MDVSIIGSGYVGTTVAACFADLGHEVVNVDVDQEIVDAINDGTAPIHEDGLAELVADHAGPDGTGRLEATTDYAVVLDTDVTFLCLPTPQNDDRSIDLSVMETAAEQLGITLAAKDAWHTVIVKSTVVPGSTEDAITPILEAASEKTVGDDFGVGMNPEFLREGTAVHDFLDPDKVVLGADDERALADIHEVFDPLIERSDAPVVETDTRTAEMIKYANNGFLAAKISLINDIGNICKEFGIDAYEVADAIALDDRIGEQFLRSGIGWGGSCFEKDTAAIRAAARDQGYEPAMLDAATEVNDRQPTRLLSLMDAHVDVAGERVAVLGLAFKPGTDDIRNSRAIPVIEGLQERGAEIVAYDPVAIETMRERFPDVEYVDTPDAALSGAVAALVVTDWEAITALDEEFGAMRTPVVVDGRRAIDRRDGIVYEGLTW
ncbi:UDP-glucose 6-dehydrogenase AglM [Halorubrum ezzemoulense]|uniref:UDP-glucose 6-dehydrogenase AglM n=1 Tax=Halorubrum ezzemoulense TaxID=337243 RepID=UPI00232FE427|nr:UDP-glucose 6-dehydrogenase AglM [Halorubrum ezzemoulense]MDB9250757.1 UDP-glucose 6-dehydrogenase AglM [Halorubrum ezzemoulense]MDB9260876.1 UDP-glucose 6-dehydrogenase AglM [Halorubrum ezzemoulense]MDB9264284.1 UDP-glucose 6-dehydrogenase AglM [Halorubrum ezzemoulense]MDB9267776.1 UDP-glucose 6-dehydrogenase AglM [Halorubrum ezzemoulense]MDB9271237.1 UDP-glucose 6-dehydrogenase AglM [Halorubrum ezzemoulense]